MPALRVSGANVEPALRAAGRAGASGRSNRRLANVFVCGEIALGVVLVTAALLLVRSVATLRQIDPGFSSESIVTVRISPPQQQYGKPEIRQALYDQLLTRLRSLPGVESVGAVDRLPMTVRYGPAMRIEGQAEDLSRTLPTIDHGQIVTPDYFTTMRIPVLAGRPFTQSDGPNAPPVALVSESLARRFWPGGNAIGKRVGNPWPSDWITIVGVVGDAKLDSLTGTTDQTIYRPFAQVPPATASLVIRTRSDLAVIGAAVRNSVATIDRTVPVSNIQSMTQVVETSAARPRFTMLLLATFAGVALLLGVIGIYGVMSYAVASRTREIGVRLALGAAPSDALRLVLRDGMTLAAVGIGIGVSVALASTRLMSGLLYGVSPTDPLTLAAAPVTLLAVALLASYLPARRATRVDPTTALRAD